MTLRLLLATLLLTTGTVQAAQRDIAVAGFNGVDVAIAMDLDVVQGNAEGLKLEGDEAAIAQVEAVVERGVVLIRQRDRNARLMGKVRGVLRARRLDQVALSGTGNVRVAELSGEEVKATLSGSGRIEVARIEARSAGLFLPGSGSVQAAAGRAQSIEVGISGSGEVEAPRIPAIDAKVAISGSGSATVATRESLQVRISGTGKVGYYGDPRVQERGGGVGKVSRLGPLPN